MKDEQIKHMVDRFLNWRLPKPWHPDNGISYQRPNYAHAPADHDWPTGTNLFDATQADAMVRHMLEGISQPDPMRAFDRVFKLLGMAAAPEVGPKAASALIIDAGEELRKVMHTL